MLALFHVHRGRDEFAYVGGLGGLCSLTIKFYVVPMGTMTKYYHLG